MSASIPIGNREPQRIAAGDTVSWTRAVNDYSSADWSLYYIIRNRANQYKFTATANSGNFTVLLNSNVTANWAPGLYAMGAYVTATNGTQQVQVKTAFPSLTVIGDLAVNPQGVDPVSWAAKMLPIIEETIAKLTARTVDSAQVNGQAYTLADIAKLYQMREKFKSEVRREQAMERLNAGLGATNKIGVRFKLLNAQGYPANYRVPWQ